MLAASEAHTSSTDGSGSDGSKEVPGAECDGKEVLSEHLLLAVKYRLGKKLLLRHVMAEVRGAGAAGSSRAAGQASRSG